MRRITHISRSLVVAAVFVATAVLAAAFPLVALADGPGPGTALSPHMQRIREARRSGPLAVRRG